MKVSYNWLQSEYFEDTLPTPEIVREALTQHAFEVESVEVIGSDTLFDIKVLPDRSHDCLSHIGIAREIALLSGLKLKREDSFEDKKFPESNKLVVEVEDHKACPRFSALMIEGVEVKESPAWLKERLEVIGQRSINNIVDATNYVMFSLGQPLHAYDRDRLKEHGGEWKISVRKARSGEKVHALDDKEYALEEGFLIIVDGNTDAPLGIAGVKGGKATEISKDTKNIILEAANFDPILIRGMAKKLGLRTDASVRFENAITPELTLPALNMMASLILNIAQGEHFRIEGLCDLYPKKPNPYKVGVSLSDVENLIGVSMEQKQIEDILNRRGYEWKKHNVRNNVIALASSYLGRPYKHGSSVVFDAPQTFDCSSFTSYLYAQSGVALPRIAIDQYVFGSAVEEKDLEPGDLVFSNTNEEVFKGGVFFSKVLGKLVDHKPIRTETLEFMPGTQVKEGVDHVGVYVGDGFVIHATNKAGVLKEKIKESTAFKQVIGYRRFISYDEDRIVVTIPAERLDLRIKEDLIEEIGRIYGYQNLKSKAIDVEKVKPEVHKKTHYEDKVRTFFIERGFSEVITYVFREKGEVELLNPLASDKKFLRNTLVPGLTEALDRNMRNADLLGLQQIKIFEIGNIFEKDHEYTALSFCIANSREYKGKASQLESEALISELEEFLGAAVSFSKNDAVFEVNFSKVLNVLPNPLEYVEHNSLSHIRYREYSRYPAILRDIAVFIPEGEEYQEIIDIVKKESADLLVRHTLFDVFTKEFPEGKKTSYAYRLVFQSQNKTLTDEEINPIMEQVTNILNNKKGWQVR